ncbi:HTH-type transcriptional regulator TfdS [Striga asiatica]|uniref:HTH-type transcriptional regulator TfdS n=1 Tax=Striga asiatica TaxID=4170 RepID=A0A5A7RKR5_STRAF|nr:HTH-type transcriptional regulator TfdS [Striga asiatica]
MVQINFHEIPLRDSFKFQIFLCIKPEEGKEGIESLGRMERKEAKHIGNGLTVVFEEKRNRKENCGQESMNHIKMVSDEVVGPLDLPFLGFPFWFPLPLGSIPDSTLVLAVRENVELVELSLLSSNSAIDEEDSTIARLFDVLTGLGYLESYISSLEWTH